MAAIFGKATLATQVLTARVNAWHHCSIPLIILVLSLLLVASALARSKLQLVRGGRFGHTPLLLAGKNGQQKKRTQRQRKKARRDTNVFNPNAIEATIVQETAALADEVPEELDSDSSDIDPSSIVLGHKDPVGEELASQKTWSIRQTSDSDDDLEAAKTQAQLSAKDAFLMLLQEKQQSTAGEADLEVVSAQLSINDVSLITVIPTLADVGPDEIALVGIPNTDESPSVVHATCDDVGCTCVGEKCQSSANDCIYARELLLLHHGLYRKIAKGPPGLELEPGRAVEQTRFGLRVAVVS